MVTARRSPIVALALGGGLGFAAGCQGVAGLEVKFTDAGGGASSDAGATSDAPIVGTVDAEAGRPPAIREGGTGAETGPPDNLGACPCDSSSGGLGCCILRGTEPFCSSAAAPCVQAGGLFQACAAYDPGTDSQCCWNVGPVAGGFTTLSTSCGSRPVACVDTADCAGDTCRTRQCRGVTIGACGVEPACP